MKSRTFLNQILLIFAFVVCLFCAGFLLYFMFQNKPENRSKPPQSLGVPTSSVSKQVNVIQPVSYSGSILPARLKIPKIHVNSFVQYVGLTPDGAVAAPKGPSNVAWFKLSPRPGEIGSSVIDGHSGYKNGQEAVFDNLYKLKKGDKIYVEDSTGASITFVVQGLKSYGRTESAPDVFNSSDGAAHLNLITCTGDWNPITKSHSSRLVVFTDREM